MRGGCKGQKILDAPETLAGLRAFCAVRGIQTNVVAAGYGASHSWISRLMNEHRRGSEAVMRRLRRAVEAAARKQTKTASRPRRR